jgi:diadenosine tetraphosphate (Ap4A) HIT family hydrolase
LLGRLLRVAETPEELYRRAQEAAGPDGRLAMPPLQEWETFPFEGEIRVRPLEAPVDAERPRLGEGGVGCRRCERGDATALWRDENWRVVPIDRPHGLPVIVMLETRTHLDLPDLSDELAAELGRLIVRIERAVRSVGEIGRVHVCRWGDGSEHFHIWFMARPARLPQLIGSFAAIWDDILPPTPEDVWQANLDVVARALTESV